MQGNLEKLSGKNHLNYGKVEAARKMAERVEKTSNVLRESNLIGNVEKDLLDAISLDAQGGIHLVLLKSLKTTGKFDEVRDKALHRGSRI